MKEMRRNMLTLHCSTQQCKENVNYIIQHFLKQTCHIDVAPSDLLLNVTDPEL